MRDPSEALKYPKHGVPARLALANGTSLMGVVYLKQNERILDMLCDPRPFFPVLLLAGVTLLNKSAVAQVDILSSSDFAGKEHLFPEFDQKHYSRMNV